MCTLCVHYEFMYDEYTLSMSSHVRVFTMSSCICILYCTMSNSPRLHNVQGYTMSKVTHCPLSVRLHNARAGTMSTFVKWQCWCLFWTLGHMSAVYTSTQCTVWPVKCRRRRRRRWSSLVSAPSWHFWSWRFRRNLFLPVDGTIWSINKIWIWTFVSLTTDNNSSL